MNMRLYSVAADMLEAGASGDNAAQTMGLAAMLRKAQHHEDIHFANTPAGLATQFSLLGLSPDLTEARFDALLSKNALAVMKNQDPDDLKKMLTAGKNFNSQMARQDAFLDVTLDIFNQIFDPKTEGDDANGYRVKIQTAGGAIITMFVVKQDGQYKLLDTNNLPNSIALEMLDRIGSGNLKGAKVLLDWMREDIHLEGGDDPLGGPIFPRFWTRGQAPDARKLKLAAAAILVGTRPTVNQGVSLLEDELKVAVGDTERNNIQLALAFGYALQQNFAREYEASSALMKQFPESKMAFLYSVEAFIGLEHYDEAMNLASERLKLLENDPDALQAKMRIESGRGNYKAAREWAQKLADQGKGDASLLNGTAWFALFTGRVDQADIDTAIKSSQLSKDNPHILHTLACLYAETGKTKEAYDLLVRAMDNSNLDEPDDDYWYAFGRIAEQYGEREVAVADYRKLSKPKQILAIPTSSYTLAQIRLKALGADATSPAK